MLIIIAGHIMHVVKEKVLTQSGGLSGKELLNQTACLQLQKTQKFGSSDPKGLDLGG